MLNNDLPNRIKQPAQCCIHCGKTYKKRENLNKHIDLCELLHKSKNKSLVIEEDEPLPSQRKLYQMLVDLGYKYNKLEEKIEEINKWVVKKKKKINVLEWLNTNIKPNITFEFILDKIIVTNDDVEYLLHNSFYDTLNEIFIRNLYNFSETENPIFAFTQKQNVFYIYDVIDEQKIWVELTKEKLIKFLNKVHMKIFKAFCDWKKTKKDEIKTNDSFAIMCDKTSLKIMNIDFKQEAIFIKIRNIMYTKMKTDMKALVEYEFEF
jgi:uncharacterized protein YeeX (DUF496 family)